MKLNINDEQGIELLYFIFERELKPPFASHGNPDKDGDYIYYNRDNEEFGWVITNKSGRHSDFIIKTDPFLLDIKHKVCKVFEVPQDYQDWLSEIKPYLKSWMEGQLNVNLNNVF